MKQPKLRTKGRRAELAIPVIRWKGRQSDKAQLHEVLSQQSQVAELKEAASAFA